MKKYWPYLVPFLVFLVLTYAGSGVLVNFKLIDQALQSLRDNGIPDEIVNRLQLLEGQEFTKKQDFWQAVETQIGKDATTQYKKLITKHAEIPYGAYIFYPLKTLLVAALLYYYRKSYTEIALNFSWLALLVGIIAFVVWVLPEQWYGQITVGSWTFNPFKLGESAFNPYFFGKNWLAYLLVVFRMTGAVLVVPIMEELFWRSFAIRWLIDDRDFTRVPIGTFTWFSCCVIVLGFGFEHHRWVVGILAGILYHALLYYKKDLFHCILAHAVTNLLLGIYVLITAQWTFW